MREYGNEAKSKKTGSRNSGRIPDRIRIRGRIIPGSYDLLKNILGGEEVLKSENGKVTAYGGDLTLCVDLACLVKAIHTRLSILKIIKYVFIGLTYREGEEDGRE